VQGGQTPPKQTFFLNCATGAAHYSLAAIQDTPKKPRGDNDNNYIYMEDGAEYTFAIKRAVISE